MSLFTVPQVMLASSIFEHGQLASLATADVRGWTILAYTVVLAALAGLAYGFGSLHAAQSAGWRRSAYCSRCLPRLRACCSSANG
jgi:hypothetical protein